MLLELLSFERDLFIKKVQIELSFFAHFKCTDTCLLIWIFARLLKIDYKWYKKMATEGTE